MTGRRAAFEGTCLGAKAFGVLGLVALVILVGCSTNEDGSSVGGGTQGAASGPGSDSGSPDRAGEATARAEYEDRLFDCLRDQGLRVDESGEQPEIEAADGQLEAALAACEAILGPEPAVAPATDEEITSLYEQSLEAAACIEALGYSISAPPSLEEYIESYRLSFESGGGPPPWNPHSQVQADVEQSCPQPTLG